MKDLIDAQGVAESTDRIDDQMAGDSARAGTGKTGSSERPTPLHASRPMSAPDSDADEFWDNFPV